MANDFYTATGTPANNSQGASSAMRSEFAAIEDGFDKLPIVTGNANKVVVVNAGGTGMEAKTLGASSVSNTPAGGISATTVQAAIDELDTEKAPKANPAFTGTIGSDGGLELTVNATGNRNSILDFHADDVNVDYSSRILRASGVNGTFDITQAGTGLVRVFTGGSSRVEVNSSGHIKTPDQPRCQASRITGIFETYVFDTSYGILGTFSINRGGFYAGSTVGASGTALHVPATGLYRVELSIFAAASTGAGRLNVLKNNASTVCFIQHGGDSTGTTRSAFGFVEMTTGDYLNLRCTVASLSLLNANQHTFVTVEYLG